MQYTKNYQLGNKKIALSTVWKNFSLMIRLRDRICGDFCNCISCGKVIDYKYEAEAGHYIPKTKRTTYFEEKNVHAQCHRCNYYLHGNQIEYRKAIVKKYGEDVVSKMEAISKLHIKFSHQYLKEINDRALQQIKLMEHERG